MIEDNLTKEELERELEEVKQQLQILDMIDERLFEMRKLASKIIKEDMTDKEIKEANKKVQKLKQEVILLEGEKTSLS